MLLIDICCNIIWFICLILNELVFSLNLGLSIKQYLKKADVIKLLLIFKNVKGFTLLIPYFSIWFRLCLRCVNKLYFFFLLSLDNTTQLI